ncbi:hypothetical protein T4D_14777 [Trichinella pseudospiralis]|uniref:Uncharacterized protein n=1 Tax=Trichinella pseudospiralis TaxID=6337 RepID=A0A0V1DPN3_TRIPS|nr:hypothetical protein T4D_14777 [Trichinella pseudospiralis]
MVFWKVRPHPKQYLGMYAIRRARDMFIDLPS